jgi:hypothetical protein
MRPPGRLEKESERALLKTASKRTEQYVNEKHSVLRCEDEGFFVYEYTCTAGLAAHSPILTVSRLTACMCLISRVLRFCYVL